MVVIGLLLLFTVALMGSLVLSKFYPWKLEQVRCKLAYVMRSKFYRYFNIAFWVWFGLSFFLPILNSGPIALVMLTIGFIPAFYWVSGKARDIRRKFPILR